MKKLGKRSLPSVIPSSSETDARLPVPFSSWMSEFAANLNKNSVQSRKEDSIYDQISSVMNSHKPRYPSVEAAVRDMQERSGLLDYRNSVQAAEKASTDKVKQAAEAIKANKEAKPKAFEMNRQIQYTCDNYIEDSKGNLPIPAILDKVRSIHKHDVSDDKVWDDESLLKYMNEKNIEAKKKYPNMDDHSTSLGKTERQSEGDVDPANTNAFLGLMPTKV